MKPLAILFALISVAGFAQAAPSHQAELIFPLEDWHNHGSCTYRSPNRHSLFGIA